MTNRQLTMHRTRGRMTAPNTAMSLVTLQQMVAVVIYNLTPIRGEEKEIKLMVSGPKETYRWNFVSDSSSSWPPTISKGSCILELQRKQRRALMNFIQSCQRFCDSLTTLNWTRKRVAYKSFTSCIGRSWLAFTREQDCPIERVGIKPSSKISRLRAKDHAILWGRLRWCW